MGDEMLNTVKAIKTALGGESGGETYGSELLNTVIEIKDLVESGGGGGGSSLPSYTDADKGKVLGLAETDGTVAPAWVNGGGGGLLVTVTAGTGTDTLNKNYTEITTAIQNGINPVFIMEIGGVIKFPVLTGMEENESGPYYCVTLEIFGDTVDYSSESPTGVLTWNAQ